MNGLSGTCPTHPFIYPGYGNDICLRLSHILTGPQYETGTDCRSHINSVVVIKFWSKVLMNGKIAPVLCKYTQIVWIFEGRRVRNEKLFQKMTGFSFG